MIVRVVVLTTGWLGDCNFRIFLLHVDELVVGERHVFLNEVIDCFTETDFVVERWWSNKGRGLAISFWYLYGRSFFVHLVIEFTDHYLFNVLVASCLKNDELMSNNSISYLFLLCWIKAVRVRHFVHLCFTPCLKFCCGIEDGNHVAFLVTTGILIIRS